MLEEGAGGKVPRSLLLGTDMVENQKQIAQFSKKDAQVGKVTSDGSSPPSQPGGCSFFFLNIISREMGSLKKKKLFDCPRSYSCSMWDI